MKIKEEFEIYVLHKKTLEIIKLKCSVDDERFPKKITMEDQRRIYFKTIKLKKNGEIMLTPDSNFKVYTEKYTSEMLEELKYQIKERLYAISEESALTENLKKSMAKNKKRIKKKLKELDDEKSQQIRILISLNLKIKRF